MGLNTISELFLASVMEFAYPSFRWRGSSSKSLKCEAVLFGRHRVLGIVQELQDVLRSLEIHGVAVNRIVVATAADRLQPLSLKTLLDVEKSSDIVLQFLSEQLGLEDNSQKPLGYPDGERNSVVRQIASARPGALVGLDHAHSTRKLFRLGKRIVDVFGAVLLISSMAPIAVLLAFIVALDVGFPVIFWQQRPGLYGRPFKLFKFRTMRPPHDQYKNRIPDDERSSGIGRLIRRLRLDELPQLYNVLIGEMSLIGPRPLLPRDQSPEYASRLCVQPGITGWAQVNGGRIIPSSEKFILDIWYAQNASFVLDLKIVLRTITFILFGDRHNAEAVNRARIDLGLKAWLRTPMIPAE